MIPLSISEIPQSISKINSKKNYPIYFNKISFFSLTILLCFLTFNIISLLYI